MRDLSHLPPAGTPEGRPPDEHPRFGPALLHAILAERMAADERPMAAEDARFRASWGGKCSRFLAYAMTGQPKTNPPDVISHWSFLLGQLVHDAIDAVAPLVFPGAEVEVARRIPLVDDDGEIVVVAASHADLVVPAHPEEPPSNRRVAIEVKSTNGYGYKLKSTNFRGPEQGPDMGAVVQGAIACVENDCDELVVLLFSLEAISKDQADRSKLPQPERRVTAEWTFSREECEQIVAAEYRRVKRVTTLIDADGDPTAVPRKLWSRDQGSWVEIRDPQRGAWEQRQGDGTIVAAGTDWACGYCDYQDRCVSDAG